MSPGRSNSARSRAANAAEGTMRSPAFMLAPWNSMSLVAVRIGLTNEQQRLSSSTAIGMISGFALCERVSDRVVETHCVSLSAGCCELLGTE